MRILGLFLNNEIRTGANRRYLELMESLASRGHKVYVLMNSYLQYQPVSFTRIEIPVKYRRKTFPPASWLFRKKILKSFHMIPEIDWIHIHSDMHLPAVITIKKRLTCGLFFAYRCNDIKRAHIMRKYAKYSPLALAASFVHEIHDRLRERSVARHSSIVTFQNEIDRDDFIERTKFAECRTIVIPGNIGLPRCSEENKNINQSTHVRNIVYVGLLSVSKGLQFLLEALSQLRDRGFRELRLSILGKTEGAESAFRLIERLGIGEMVTIEGYNDPFPFLAKCDILVYPTLYDAFPDAVLEALHAGCPVIASRVGGLPDMLRYPELLFDLGDIGGIADRIEKCVTDNSHYKRLRSLCADRAAEYRFDWTEKFERAMLDYSE